MVASVPLVLTFVKVAAAIAYECQNRDTSVAAGVRLMRAAANDTVALLPGLRAVIPAFVVGMRPF